MVKATGCLIPVVGPSGAGKDSLIRAAQLHFKHDARFSFPRRIVTRKAQADSEDHDSMTEIEFAKAVADDQFAFWWGAHNNSYGIPATIWGDLARGRSVVFNCSRNALQEVLLAHLHVVVFEITAPDDVLVKRIVARGRETREQAMQRISRKASLQNLAAGRKRTIANDGALEDAIAAFIAALETSHQPATDPGGQALNRNHKKKDRNNGGRRLVVVEHLK